VQLLDLANGDRAIRAFEDPFNQAALGVPGAIRKLWHGRLSLLPRNLSRSSLIV
jgi:hypothetical protein